MKLITLISDFGLKDYYVPMFKGDILNSCGEVNIVDITHDIPAFDINRAAFILGNCYDHFPKGTVHIARVFENGGDHQRIVIVKHNGYYFIGPNNGLISLVLSTKPESVYFLNEIGLSGKSLEEKYCIALNVILSGRDISEIASVTDEFVEKIKQQSVLFQKILRGNIEHIDHFGNAITNIMKEDFEKLAMNNGDYVIQFRRFETIEKVSAEYSDVHISERLARFNSKEMLEIAVNCGEAASLLGLQKGDFIQIEFK